MSTIFPNVREWYEIDGVELSTHGYSIETITNSIPDRKGENVSSPVIHGDLFREKRLNPRNESWTIWITDADPSTGAVSSTEAVRRSQFNKNYDTVMNLLNKFSSELVVTKKLIDPTMATSNVVSRQAKAEIAGGFNLDDHRELGIVKFSVDVRFLDPRWYDTSDSTATGTLSSATTTSFNVTAANVGTAPVNKMTITFAAGTGQSLTNPRLANTIGSTTVQIGYTGTISAGQSVIIDTENLTMTKGGTNVISDLYRAGSRQDWMEFSANQTNAMVFSTTATSSGTVTISYKKAYF